MSEAILAALIAAAASIICQLILHRSNARRDSLERALRQQKLDNDIAELTKRVSEHNSYAQMFAEQTKSLNQLSSDIRVMQKDIEYIKEGRFDGKSEK